MTWPKLDQNQEIKLNFWAIYCIGNIKKDITAFIYRPSSIFLANKKSSLMFCFNTNKCLMDIKPTEQLGEGGWKQAVQHKQMTRQCRNLTQEPEIGSPVHYKPSFFSSFLPNYKCQVSLNKKTIRLKLQTFT